MDPTHLVYSKPPVTSASVEVRFPENDGSTLPVPLQRAFKERLGDGWVMQSSTVNELALSIGPAGAVSQSPTRRTIPTFLVRDRTLAVAVTPESMTIETTRYSDYTAFRRVIHQALDAAAEIIQPEGVARVGLRYIDELRVPGIDRERPYDWQEWVDDSLLPPEHESMSRLGYAPKTWQGLAEFAMGADQSVVLRYGPRPGPLRVPDGPLRRPVPPDPGPWFLLDFDASWNPPDFPEFTADAIVHVCDELREPIHALFEALITEPLRVHFNKEQNP